MFKNYLLALVALLISTNSYAHKPGFYKIDGKDEVQVVFHKSGLKCNLEVEGAQEKEGYLRLFVFSESATKEPYFYESGFYVEMHFPNTEGSMVENYVRVDYVDQIDETTNNCVQSSKGTRLFAENGKLGNFEITYHRELPVFVKQ